MVFDPSVLDNMSREELIAQARVLGAERAELLTRVELRDEIVRRSATDVVERQRLRGFLGVARDLVANVVEAGLNLPEAAARIRGETPREEWKGPTPVATVTLAEIYVAQGHSDRALTLLDQILSKEPEHEVASELRARLLSEDREASKRRAPRAETSAPEAESTPVSASAPLSESAPDLSAPPEPAPAPAPVQEIPPPPGPNPAQPVASSAAAQAPSVATLSSADGSLYVYWEVPESLLERGLALVRVATFRARGSSVEQTTRDLPVTTAQGGQRITGIDGDTFVRAVFGVQRGQAFSPLAVAPVARVAGGDVPAPLFRPRWAPDRAFEAIERRALGALLANEHHKAP